VDGASGIRYRPEHCGDSAPTNWTLLAPVALLDNKMHYLEDPLTNHARCLHSAAPQSAEEVELEQPSLPRAPTAGPGYARRSSKLSTRRVGDRRSVVSDWLPRAPRLAEDCEPYLSGEHLPAGAMSSRRPPKQQLRNWGRPLWWRGGAERTPISMLPRRLAPASYP